MMNDEKSGLAEVVETKLEQIIDTKPERALSETMVQEGCAGKPNLQVVQRSDVGAVRKRNEDSCLVFSPESGGHFPLKTFGLYLVADGMGGHESGHMASKGASRAAARHILQEIYLPLLGDDAPEDNLAIQAILRDSVLIAHKAIYDPDPARDGGTTLTAAVVLDHTLYIAHVGDSRAYWLIDGNLEAITSDHSLVQRLQDEGKLTAEEAHEYQYRNILLRALGQEDELEVDVYQRALPHSGKLLLCSDGLCGLVQDEDLQRIMNQPNQLKNTVDQLISAAMVAGGYDNITAVVVDFCF